MIKLIFDYLIHFVHFDFIKHIKMVHDNNQNNQQDYPVVGVPEIENAWIGDNDIYIDMPFLECPECNGVDISNSILPVEIQNQRIQKFFDNGGFQEDICQCNINQK